MRRWLLVILCTVCLHTLTLPAWALPSSNAITDYATLLRRALPYEQPTLHKVDELLYSAMQGTKRSRWSETKRDLEQGQKQLQRNAKALQTDATKAADYAELTAAVDAAVGVVDSRDRDQVGPAIDSALARLGELEYDFVTYTGPTIPPAYADLPYLAGYATVDLETSVGTFSLLLDGYNAPLTAGNFVDLVQRHFYDGLDFDRVEIDFVAQGGKPSDADGYIDPATGLMRTIPLEIRPEGLETPIYGQTLDDAGFWNELPALPFAAKGAIAMARYSSEANSASSQFFFSMANPDVTPAGLNLLDGRYAVFGYTTAGTEYLDNIHEGDRILKATVTSGLDRLIQPAA